MLVFTDYPPPNLTDKQPLRRVKLVSFDGDKYVTTDTGESFKAGYAYRTRRRTPYRYSTLDRRLARGDN